MIAEGANNKKDVPTGDGRGGEGARPVLPPAAVVRRHDVLQTLHRGLSFSETGALHFLRASAVMRFGPPLLQTVGPVFFLFCFFLMAN